MRERFLCTIMKAVYPIEQYRLDHPGVLVYGPQEGFQERFTRSNVDVAFGGGVLNPQPVSSVILTPHGYERIGDIRPGDIVLGIGNELQRVLHADNVGEKECIRIILDDGSSAESSLDHKWWILRDGIGEMTAIGFELLEAFQICRDRMQPTDISVFRLIDAHPVPVHLREVQEIGMKECVCIGVSNDDQLYITDNGLITKNCGKAQPYSARILTPRGWTTMGALKEGDVISSPGGGTQTVLRIYEKGVPMETMTVKTWCGNIRTSPDHLWYLYDSLSGEYCIKMTRDLCGRSAGRYHIPCCREIRFDPLSDVSDYLKVSAEMLGGLLGTDPYFVRSSNALMAKVRTLGIDIWNPRIPASYLWGEIKVRKDFLRGFLRARTRDDRTVPDTIKIVLTEDMAYDLQHIVMSLGGVMNILDFKEGGLKMGVITMPSMEEILSGEEKQRKNLNIPIVDVIPSGNTGWEPYRCILVSGRSHTYITDHFIVTHNTFAAILSVAEPAQDGRFRGAFTRRNLGNLKQGGGIVDDFMTAYGSMIHATTSENPRITFPSGAYVDCLHIADEEPNKLMERAKGWQYDYFYLDELTSYEFSTFSIVGTRCRGKAVWTGKIRGTTNPKRSHWTRRMVHFYVDEKGFISPERDGVVIYYYQGGEKINDLVFGRSKEEVYQQCRGDIDEKLRRQGPDSGWDYRNMIRSFVFYVGRMAENKASIGNNANYIGAVTAVGGRRAKQLIEGNWNVDEEEDFSIPIPSNKAQEVFTNDDAVNGDEWITVDLADVGVNNLLAIKWNGFHIQDILVITSSTPYLNFQKIKSFALKHNIADSHIIYDATRATYMYDYIPDAIPFISSASVRGKYGIQADRLKDECYLRLVYVINNNMMSCDSGIAMSYYTNKALRNPITIQEEFLEECSVVQFREKPNGKKKLLSKKEMNAALGKERSMDLLDPCAMRMLPILDTQYGDELDSSKANSSTGSKDQEEEFNIYDERNWC